MTRRALHWFRRDLRIDDNRALHGACAAASDGVVGVYVLSPGEWDAHYDAPAKIDFWLRNLAELSKSLARLNVPLVITRAATPEKIPDALHRVANDAKCDALFYNREYEVNESQRDAAVMALFEKRGRTVHPHDDRCIIAPGEVVTKEGGFYSVFTPFQNRFLEVLADRAWAPVGTPKKQKPIDVGASDIPASVEGFESAVDPKHWPPGERVARRRLETFLSERAASYAENRDFPALDATSALSPYLNSGIISPRACVAAAMEADGGVIRVGKAYKGKPTGIGKWISEVIWREFYIHITHNFPRVCMGRAFKPVDRSIRWRYDEGEFQAWCEGRTGFPLVDASMRQLNTIGWMHNRVRMVVAMFLTKDLLIDWRWGERYFMRHLVDGDLGSNNGGWQWSASTGTDAAPYFRVYNPITQSERYDPEGAFIHRWVPELRDLTGKELHDPSRIPALLRSQLDYPEAMVDHGKARARVLDVFKSAGG
jgi:deoxyribodipyrimidine photo-lyase